MLQLMARPVAAVRPASGQTIMGKTSGPHYLCPGIVIVRFCHQDLRVFHHRPDQMLADPVCHLHVLTLIEIALHCVHHNINAPAGSLVFRQCHGKLRIHDGKSCSPVIAAVSPLEPSVLIRYNRRITHLGSCRRNGQDHTDREAPLCSSFLLIEIPHIPAISHTVTDGFGGIDHTAAAYSQNEVCIFPFAELDPLIYKRQPGIRHDSSQRHIWDTCLVKRTVYTVQQPASYHTAAPVVDKHFPAALLCHKLPGLVLGSLSKHNFSRRIILKILHTSLSFSCLSVMFLKLFAAALT